MNIKGILGTAVIGLFFAFPAGSQTYGSDPIPSTQTAPAPVPSQMGAIPQLPPGKYKFKVSPFSMNVPVPGPDGKTTMQKVTSDKEMNVEFEVVK